MGKPQVTISVARLCHLWFISVTHLNFPLKTVTELFAFPLSLAPGLIHRAAYSNLLGFSSFVFDWNKNVNNYFQGFPLFLMEQCHTVAKNPNVGKIPVELSEVEAVAHNETIRDLKAPEGYRNFHDPPGALF